METRELAYFVALAEELNFGRAADRVGIAQPPLSRAIQRLERRLGTLLVKRGPKGVTLTPAGEVLHREAKDILDAVDAATRRTQRAGRSTPTLVVAVKPGGDGGLLPEVLAAYARDPSALPVEPLVRAVGEVSAAIRAGDADVALIHQAAVGPGVDTVELTTERQVVVVAKNHRLAGCSEVRLSDLVGERTPSWPGQPGIPGPDVRDVGQLLQLVALGRIVAMAGESIALHLRADVVSVPVVDAPESTLVAAWAEGSRSAAVARFVTAAQEVIALSRNG